MDRAQLLPTLVVFVETQNMHRSPEIDRLMNDVKGIGLPTEHRWEKYEVDDLRITSLPAMVLKRTNGEPRVVSGQANIDRVVRLLREIAAGVFDKAPEPAVST